MRPSTLLFAIAGGLAIAQFLPFIGLISIIGAAYLVGLVLDLALVVLIAEGVIGVAPRWQALTAVALFGAYVAAAALSKRQATTFEQALRAGNASAIVHWAKGTNDLLLINNGDDETFASRLTARALIEDFVLERVYRHRDGSPDPISVVVASNGPCAVADTAEERFRRVSRGGWCFRTDHGEPTRPVVRIEAGPRTTRSTGLIRTVRQEIVIRPPAGAPVMLHAGYAEALPWMPWPVIGMEWSGGGSYTARVAVRLAREGRPAYLRREDQLAIVVAALRLTRRAPGSRG